MIKTFEKFSNFFDTYKAFKNQYQELNKYLEKKNLLLYFDNIKNIISKWDKNLFIHKQNYEILLNEIFKRITLFNSKFNSH